MIEHVHGLLQLLFSRQGFGGFIQQCGQLYHNLEVAALGCNIERRCALGVGVINGGDDCCRAFFFRKRFGGVFQSLHEQAHNLLMAIPGSD